MHQKPKQEKHLRQNKYRTEKHSLSKEKKNSNQQGQKTTRNQEINKSR